MNGLNGSNGVNGVHQPAGILKVKNQQIVDENGKEIFLLGAAVTNLNTENFIVGYSGHESEVRRELKRVLGEEKATFFWNKLVEYFWTDADARFFHNMGLNCVRIPINYHWFEDDMNDGVYKAEGFAQVDRMVNICAKAGIYTILDLHTAPGGQSQGWHCDSGIQKALFWEHKVFQDRFIAMWKAIAAHYKGNAWVAGYNPLNEPADEFQYRLQNFYERIEKEIRSVDPDHILFLDGNSYAKDFSAFKKVLPNSVYAIHDYSGMGFAQGDRYKRTPEQKKYLRESYDRKCDFMIKHKVPIWNGEFGPVYAAQGDPDWEQVNQERINLLEDQLKIYRETRISHSIWLYKDVGFQGMVYVKPDTPYMKLMKPFIDKKKRLALDAWGRDDRHVKDIWEPVVDHIYKELPERYHKAGYPYHWGVARHLARNTRELFLGELFAAEYADYFEGKTKEELDELAASFKFENCNMREPLNDALMRDSRERNE